MKKTNLTDKESDKLQELIEILSNMKPNDM